MPEYLAPGVYVEEVSFRSKSIEGVSTTTTGFVGPARYGPIDLEPDVITSLGEFERVYGDGLQLKYGSDALHNFLWHGARAFFEEGGRRLYVARVFKPLGGDDAVYAPPAIDGTKDQPTKTDSLYNDGHARALRPAEPTSDAERARSILIRARFPGAAGNVRVRFTLQVGQNVLGGESGRPRVSSLLDKDIVWIGDITSPFGSPPGTGSLYVAEFDTSAQTWKFKSGGTTELSLSSLDPTRGDTVRPVTLTLTITPSDVNGIPSVWTNLPADPGHERAGSPDSLFSQFGQNPTKPARQLNVPVVTMAQARQLPIEILSKLSNGLDVLKALFAWTTLDMPDPDTERSAEVTLAGGNDGKRPFADDYAGKENATTGAKTGLTAFEDIEDISIVAAPGSTFGLEDGYRAHANTIVNQLISHAARMRYRIAVLDSGNVQSIAEVRAMRARLDSKYAALYYPWVRVLDPVTRQEIHLPPSGFVAGIYARNDITRAVYKAPANEVVNLAIGFEQLLNKSQQEVLNPEGINCLRFFEGRGFLVWGARTVSSDPEWKYVNLRRYFAYLERSIDRGTQWAVFEPNGEALWANVRRTIEDFLFNEWASGALLGDKPEKAFFVRCDRSTMTQNDLDNGRLVCLIGVAPLRPAEFVIFRIGQWTADRKS